MEIFLNGLLVFLNSHSIKTGLNIASFHLNPVIKILFLEPISRTNMWMLTEQVLFSHFCIWLLGGGLFLKKCKLHTHHACAKM